MADITPQRINIQAEEVRYKAAVSESTNTRLGAAINFINYYQAKVWQFNLNGAYNNVTTPNLQVDGILSFPFAWEIVDLYIYAGNAVGSGGTTELDLKWATGAGTSYSSIFSTTPKFTSSASANQTCWVGESKTGFTTPVLNKTQFDAKDKLRIDLLQAMSGTVEGCGVAVVYRPR